jgi:hypothetical protein
VLWWHNLGTSGFQVAGKSISAKNIHEFLEECDRAFQEIEALEFIPPNILDPAINAVVNDLCEILFDDTITIDLRIRCISRIPDFIYAAYATSVTELGSLYMFWDILLNYRGADGISHSPAIQLAVVTALERQLQFPHELTQFSALHGLNHLVSAQSELIVREFLTSTHVPALTEYALAAAAHRAL